MTMRSLIRLRYHIRDLIDYLRAFTTQDHTNMRALPVIDKQSKKAARRLHADVYLQRKFITKQQVVNGMVRPSEDPYYDHAQYFIVLNKANSQIIATARQIEARAALGYESFPMFKHTKLYDKTQAMLRNYSPANCVEISALAKHRGVSKLAPLLLYKTMWQYSLQHRHQLWLLAVDHVLYVRLKLLFGPAIQQAGPKTFYMGSWTVPAVLKLQFSLRSLEKSLQKGAWYKRFLRYRVTQFMLRDVSTDMLTPVERAAYTRIMARYHR